MIFPRTICAHCSSCRKLTRRNGACPVPSWRSISNAGKFPVEQPDPPRVLTKGWSKGGGSNDKWRLADWPHAGLIVMGLAAIVALATAASGYFSSDFLKYQQRGGFLLVCASSVAVAVLAASLPILESGSHGLVALSVVLCVLDLLGTSIAAFLLERPVTVAAMAVAALGLTDHLMRPRAAAMARSIMR